VLLAPKKGAGDNEEDNGGEHKMKYKICRTKIPCRQYVGLGKFEKLCLVHAREAINKNG